MKLATEKFVSNLQKRFSQIRTKEPASVWCEAHLNLNEPKIKGRFSFYGREYLREIVDAWGVLPDNLVGGRNFIFVGGTGVGKTIGTVGGVCSRVANWPTRALIVKPAANGPAGARSFSRLVWHQRLEQPRFWPTRYQPGLIVMTFPRCR